MWALRHLPAHQEQEAAATATAVLIVALGIGGVLACGLPLCPFASITGLPCPGCGLLRAVLALVHGDVAGALHFHPLVLAALPVGLVAMVHGATSWPRGPRGRRALHVVTTVMVTSLAVVWLARFLGEFGGPVTVRTYW